MKKYMFLSITFLLTAFLLSMGTVRLDQEAMAQSLAPSLLRFHILANSDSSEDQEVKLEVRSLILDYVQSHLDQTAGKQETIQYLEENRETVETLADGYLEQRGFAYQTSLEVTNCYFPSRTYDDLTFPGGYYDAARITLGKGEGHNWWCVLYPRLCFVDAVCSEVPEESADELRRTLGEGGYLALQDNRPDIQTRFFFLPFLQD